MTFFMVFKVWLARKTFLFFGASKEKKVIFCNCSVLAGAAILPGHAKVESEPKKANFRVEILFGSCFHEPLSSSYFLLSPLAAGPTASLNKRWKNAFPFVYRTYVLACNIVHGCITIPAQNRNRTDLFDLKHMYIPYKKADLNSWHIIWTFIHFKHFFVGNDSRLLQIYVLRKALNRRGEAKILVSFFVANHFSSLPKLPQSLPTASEKAAGFYSERTKRGNKDFY